MYERFKSAAVLGIAMMIAMSVSAFAQVTDRHVSAEMAVSASVPPNCRLDVLPLAFDSYDPLGTNGTQNADASTTMTVVCTLNSSAAITMGGGATGSANSRKLMFGSYELQYQIFRDAARTQVWGSGADAEQVTGAGSRTPQRLTIYGRIPPAQEVPAGTYRDVVTATIDF